MSCAKHDWTDGRTTATRRGGIQTIYHCWLCGCRGRSTDYGKTIRHVGMTAGTLARRAAQREKLKSAQDPSAGNR